MDAEPNVDEIYSEEDIIAWCNVHLPLYGTVTRVDGMFGNKFFYYVALPDEWQKASGLVDDLVWAGLTLAHNGPSTGFLLKATAKVYQYNEKVKGTLHKLNKAFRDKGVALQASVCEFVAFPSNVGLHISIDSHNLGDRVEFELERWMMYENQKMGSVSAFDSSLYCTCYLAMRVKLKDPSIKLVSSTHISIAAYALVVSKDNVAAPPTKTSGKGGKKK